MRKHFSIFMLFTRASIWGCLAISAVMAAAQLGIYFLRGTPEMRLEVMIQEGWYIGIFLVAAVIMTFYLGNICTGTGGKPIYTLARLDPGMGTQFLLQSLSDAAMWAIFLCVEILTMFLIASHYCATAGEYYVDTQSLSLAFYRSEFLHSLMPLENILRWVRNLVFILGMAVICANASGKRRRGKLAMLLPGMAVAFMVSMFVAQIGDSAMDWTAIVVFVIAICVVTVMNLGAGEEIEDEEIEETP